MVTDRQPIFSYQKLKKGRKIYFVSFPKVQKNGLFGVVTDVPKSRDVKNVTKFHCSKALTHPGTQSLGESELGVSMPYSPRDLGNLGS